MLSPRETFVTHLCVDAGPLVVLHLVSLSAEDVVWGLESRFGC